MNKPLLLLLLLLLLLKLRSKSILNAVYMTKWSLSFFIDFAPFHLTVSLFFFTGMLLGFTPVPDVFGKTLRAGNYFGENTMQVADTSRF